MGDDVDWESRRATNEVVPFPGGSSRAVDTSLSQPQHRQLISESRTITAIGRPEWRLEMDNSGQKGSRDEEELRVRSQELWLVSIHFKNFT